MMLCNFFLFLEAVFVSDNKTCRFMPIDNYLMKYMRVHKKLVHLILIDLLIDLLAIREFFKGSDSSTVAWDHNEES